MQTNVNINSANSASSANSTSYSESENAKKPAEHLQDGSIVIAAITSCTNTSNPNVMMATGLLAKKACELGLKVKPWVKTSLAPGSKVVSEYYQKSGLQEYLDKLGFHVVGYGCTTCIGNSGPLDAEIEAEIKQKNLLVASVLSGNRNFEGRVHQLVKANYLMSPQLVVAYAIAGSMKIDITKQPLGTCEKTGKSYYLKDIWPSNAETKQVIQETITSKLFADKYSSVFKGEEEWQALPVKQGKTYLWNQESTYIQNPPYFEGMSLQFTPPKNINGARVLALLGDSITTDHISPAGAIAADSPAGHYLQTKGVQLKDFNSYGSRRGNHEVMMRGTFANIRIKNEMAQGKEGGYTVIYDDAAGDKSDIMPIYDAAMSYAKSQTPLVVIAGKEYGTGSSRDWAAKGTRLLGVKAVIVESFERIHRSNLIGMGVLPLQFKGDVNRISLKLNGSEKITISGIEQGLQPRQDLTLQIEYANGTIKQVELLCRLDTAKEVEYYNHGGILHKVIRDLVQTK